MIKYSVQGALQQKEKNNWIGPTAKHEWNHYM